MVMREDDIERFNIAAELFEGEESEPVDVVASQHYRTISDIHESRIKVETIVTKMPTVG